MTSTVAGRSMTPIREFVPQDSQADFDRLLPAYLALWNAPGNLPFLVYTLKPLEERRLRFEFMHHLMLGERYFAAMDGERIVGLSVLKARPAERFELAGVAVHPAEQGRGIGRQLVEHAAIIARWDGFDAMEASVFADNGRMLRLLGRQRFTVTAATPQARADGIELVRLCKSIDVAALVMAG
jgi:ribosomal protein S18 acetylase RimI-like enzyme